MNSSSSGRDRLDARLAQVGRWQHRQITTEQLREAGLESDDVAYRVRIERLHPVCAEVYSLGGPPQNQRERWMAATLTYGQGTRLAGVAAADLHGMLRFPSKEIHVRTSTRRKPRDGIVTHHRTRQWPWIYIDRIPVTTIEETVLDCALTVQSDRLYRRIVRQPQAEGLVSHARLVAFAAQNPGVPGVVRMCEELAAGPSPTRSANEDEVLEVFRAGGEPIPNARIGHDEVDLYFPRLSVVVEVQSPLHDNPAAQAHDERKRQRLQERGLRVLWVR